LDRGSREGRGAESGSAPARRKRVAHVVSILYNISAHAHRRGILSQLTLYLDGETESRLRKAAKGQGVSISRFVAALISEKAAREWPKRMRTYAGAWKDLPDAESLRSGLQKDIPRTRM
jgi:hypothetical protein